jgi:hypothetical protein
LPVPHILGKFKYLFYQCDAHRHLVGFGSTSS